MQVFELSEDSRSGKLLQNISVLDGTSRGDAYISHVSLGAGGLLVGVRGADRVVLLNITTEEGGGAKLQLNQSAPVGPWPRHFAVFGNLLLVARQKTAPAVGVHRVNDGHISVPIAHAELPAPSCVLPLRNFEKEK